MVEASWNVMAHAHKPDLVFRRNYWGFLDQTQRSVAVGRTPLDAWSVRRSDLYLTTHNTPNRQTSVSSVGFEPTITAGEQPQTYALDRATTGTGYFPLYLSHFQVCHNRTYTARYTQLWINLPTWCNIYCIIWARHVSGLYAHLQEQTDVIISYIYSM